MSKCHESVLNIDARHAQGSQSREMEEEGSRQTISDINKHAAAVMRTAADLGSRGAGQQAAAIAVAQHSGMAGTALDDLRRPKLAGFSQLRIQDPKRLHESAAPQQSPGAPEHGATAFTSLTDSDALEAVQVPQPSSVLLASWAAGHEQPMSASTGLCFLSGTDKRLDPIPVMTLSVLGCRCS